MILRFLTCFLGVAITLGVTKGMVSFVAKKLDQLLVDKSWMSRYGKTVVEFLDGECLVTQLLWLWWKNYGA
jgi:hypothetical protein